MLNQMTLKLTTQNSDIHKLSSLQNALSDIISYSLRSIVINDDVQCFFLNEKQGRHLHNFF